jgi:hypothetical protein
VAQTDGEPLPEAAEASGDPGTKTAALRSAILDRGIAIEAADYLGGPRPFVRKTGEFSRPHKASISVRAGYRLQ